MRSSVYVRTFLTLVLGVALLGACGKSEKPATTGLPATSSGTTTTSSAVSSESGETEIKLTGLEYKYDAGTAAISLPAGKVKVTLTNGGQEEHQATILRLNDGVDLTQLGAAAASDPTGAAALKLVTAYGGPNGVAPGKVQSSSQVLDKAGNYLFICFIPAADGQPHAAKGMFLPFSVTGSSTDTESAASTASAVDFGYKLPDSLKSGTVALRNDGQQAHEMAVYQLADGKKLDDLIAFFAASGSGTPPSGPPPFTAAGGLGPIAPGTTATVDLKLTSGKDYVFICFLPDVSGSGAPHFTKGMAQVATAS